MAIFSLLLAGCGREEITAENIVKKMQETQASTNDVHAVVRLDFTSPQESGFVTAEYWTRKTGTKDDAGNEIAAVRFKVIDASAKELVGAEAVSDGAKGWLYSPSENTAFVGTKDEIEKNRPEFGGGAPGAGGGRGAMDPTAALGELQKIVEKGLAAVDIQILGEEAIAGHNAHKLKITPKQETQEQLQLPVELLVETTAWIDSERYLPLKFVLDAKDMGKVEVVAQTLDTNAGVDAAQFSAAPPAGAKIVQIADMLKEMEKNREQAGPVSLDDAKAQAGFAVLEPSAAPNQEKLVDVQLLTMPSGKTVIQTYSGSGIEWSLVQSQGEERQGSSLKGTEVKVRGTTGTLIEGTGSVGTLLSWKENGISFVIAGNLSAEDAQAVAESLK
ncbi:MAG TPA: DUF4367 domain-containing protein [Herpetosiphonaceae bacterium]